MSRVPTPSQTVGPFFHLGFDGLAVADLASGAASGERIVIAGRILDGEGAAVPDAVIELWQANSHGKYPHPADRQEKPLDPGFSGFGRLATDRAGGFRFTTVKPGRVPGLGNALQAPHIGVAVAMRGLLRHLYTRIYFSDEPSNREDPVLALIEDGARRRTLVAERQGASPEYRWDIVLQGPDETVFLDI